MKRLGLLTFIVLLSFWVIGCGAKAGEPGKQAVGNDEEQVRQLVEAFGSKLQNVSLMAPKDMVSKSIWESYASYVSSSLLEKWQKDPENAPGRVSSSPWPDRIDIHELEKQEENVYTVQGEVIEVTSVEKEKGGYAVKRPVSVAVRKTDGQWLIDELVMGEYQYNRK